MSGFDHRAWMILKHYICQHYLVPLFNEPLNTGVPGTGCSPRGLSLGMHSVATPAPFHWFLCAYMSLANCGILHHKTQSTLTMCL